MRLNVLNNIIYALLGIVIAWLFYMQIIKGDDYHEQSVNNRIRLVSSDAPRGRIYDRNGVLLADNRLSFNVAIIPQDIEDKKVLFAYLAKALARDEKNIENTFNRRRLTPFDPVVIAADVGHDTVLAVEENKYLYPGLVVTKSFERFYPFAEDGAHALGYVGKIDQYEAQMFADYGYNPLAMVGKSGIEKAYENDLQGMMGGKQIEVNSRGQQVRLLSTKEPLQGKDITLTIDERLQRKAQELLDQQKGAIVVMDITTGEIITLVSAPSYNPNAFTDKSINSQLTEYFQNPQAPLLNRAISGQYPPGSVFKIPVALAAVERKKITPSTTFMCPGFYMLGKARFGCAHEHGPEDLYNAIAHSCNVYFYRIGQMITAPIMSAYAKAFGFSKLTGIDLPFENKGSIVGPPQKKDGWFTGNTLNLSIGQGDTLATPLQVTVMIAAVANNGVIVKPRVLKAKAGELVPAADLSKRPTIRLKEETWQIVKKGMYLVVEDPGGTAHVLSTLKNMDIWGKTGTAQSTKGQEHHAWFSGFVRSPKNNLAFCVFLEHGGSSANAVTITQAMLQHMQYLSIL